MQRLAVFATLTLALLLTGAVSPWERAAVAWGWAFAMLALPRGAPDAVVRSWVRGVGWLILAGLPGLVGLPAGVVVAVAPGLTKFLGDRTSAALAVASDATLAALVDVGVFGVAGVAFAGALRGLCTERLARGVTAGAALVVSLSLLHAGMGWTSWLGLVPIRDVDRVFFPPLINPNHTGALLVAALPYVWRARGTVSGKWRLAVDATLVGILTFPLLARSMGVAVALVVVGFVAALRQDSRARRWAAVGVGAAAAVAVALAVASTTPRWWALSVAPRLTQWQDTLSMVRAFPWFGVGLGGYGAGYSPWRTVPGFLTFSHAHSDGLEWIAETGLWGVACAIAGLRSLRRVAGERRDDPAPLALLGLLVAAGVDFPLHIPAVAFVLAALGVSVLGAGTVEAPAQTPRAWGGAALLLALAATLFAVRASGVSAAIRSPEGPVADSVLARSPWGEDAALVWLARAETRTGTERITALERAAEAAPGSAKVARGVAALASAEVPAPTMLDAWLTHALVLDPQDLRLWWLAAQRRARSGDPSGAALGAADAFRRWPHEVPTSPAVWEEAWGWLPVGLWWLDALADAPAHWSARLGWWLLREGDAETALLAMEQAAALRPDVFTFSSTHIDALLALGRTAQAREEAQAWTQAAPEHAWAWVALASVALSAGDDPLGGAVTIAAWRTADQPVARRLLFGCIQACEVGRCACDLDAARALLDAERADDRGDAVRCAASRDRVRDANPWLRAHGSGLACAATNGR